MPMHPRMEGDESNQSVLEEQPGGKRAKLEMSETDRLLNFTTAANEFELSLKRQKLPRDPMSHRIIEKRRRDRMNNCLADLSRLIPSSYHKQGQGRIEKTEIIEMAIKHINLLQHRLDSGDMKASKEDKPQTQLSTNEHHCCITKFYMGFKEAQDEVMRFLVEVESINAMDPFCKKIMNHLENASKKFINEPMSRSPLSDDVEKTDIGGMDADNSQSAFLPRSAFYPTPIGGSTGQEDNSLSMDNKHQDKHLRSLLAEQQHSLVSLNNSSGSISETSSGSNGLVPLFSYSRHLHGVSSDQNGMGSSGYMSDLSNLEKTSPSGSTSSRDNVYKFKHNITKRFSQEGHHHHIHHHHHMQHHHHKHGQPSDTSSSTSSRDLEDDQSQLKWKSSKHKARHGGTTVLFQDEMEGQSGGNNSANSDEFNSESVSNDCPRRRSSCKSAGQNSNHSSDNGSSSVALPGFILHPQGTHYMPISVHNTNISGLFENASEHDGPLVFHPISIPVHFRQPVISMPNITICTHMSSQRRSVKE